MFDIYAAYIGEKEEISFMFIKLHSIEVLSMTRD